MSSGSDRLPRRRSQGGNHMIASITENQADTIDHDIESGKAMLYTTARGKTYRIEEAYGNLTGELLGFYAWDKDDNLVHPPVAPFDPVEPFHTLRNAQEYLEEL